MCVTIDVAIGAKLKYMRKHVGLTQKELANRLHVSQARISNTEAGRRSLRINEIIPYSRALGLVPERVYYLLSKAILENNLFQP